VRSLPLAPLLGSHVIRGLAFTVPPVKSVIMVQTVADVWNVPAGHVCPAVIVAVPEVKETVRFFARPVANDEVPESCQPSKTALTTPLLFRYLLIPGMS